MKNLYKLFFTLCLQIVLYGQVNVSYSVSPSAFDETQAITITFNVDETAFGVGSNHSLYLWAWSIDNTNASADSPTNGTWNSSGAANQLTYVSSNGNTGTYTYTMNTVKSFYGNRSNPLSQIGFLVKTQTGSIQSQNIMLPVGAFQFTASNPANSTTTFLATGSNTTISATTSQLATFSLSANGTVINSTTTPSTTYSYNYTVNQDAFLVLTATSSYDGTQKSVSYTISAPPANPTSAPIPGWIRQGINYDPNDPTRIGLALYAPRKSYVHVIGSFNNWAVMGNYQMNRDTINPDLYWLIVTGLTPQQVYTFQYRTLDSSTNTVVKVADPFSRLVLSPDDDPYISAITYPNLPAYPKNQNYDVSVVQTGMPAYNWKVTNFVKPAKENLAIYELLVRDFTTQQNWQSLIDKIPYIKGLNVNAVELLPVMEFDGNNSWGYNPGFHFALDKAYGTPEKLKEFIDTCHQNGIAVILDVVFNHATGRSPIERMWAKNTTDGGYGDVAAGNPYFNLTATHTYGMFSDFNHSAACTQYYVNRVLEQWITEYHVDGFRWDLVKGFTQNCTPTDEACTNSYQQDKVDVIKKYADYQWTFDPTSYMILENLGTDAEEQQWANYKGGIMPWNKMTDPLNQNTMGYTDNSNVSRLSYKAHGFNTPMADTYAESHDEERLMYKNLQYGNSNGSYSIKNLPTALFRMQALGALLLTIPGPRMIWQFGELGYDKSIGLCSDGTTVDPNNCRTTPKPSAFSLGYDTDTNRQAVYNTWSKILGLTQQYGVFKTSTFSIDSFSDLMPKVYIWDTNIPVDQLRNVIVITNFTTSVQNISPYFPFTGTWYNLMDNSKINVTATDASFTYTLQPGEFRIFGNSLNYLSTDTPTKKSSDLSLAVAPNPIIGGVAHLQLRNAKNGILSIYDMTGKEVKTQKLSVENGSESIRLSVNPGLYFFQLKSDHGNTTSKVIVK